MIDMKINFDSAIKNLKGVDMKSIADGKETPLILKEIVVTALLADVNIQGERPETGQEKLKKFKLAQKIEQGGEIDLIAEDISFIKEKVGKTYTTLIVGRVYELLENSTESEQKP